MRHNSADDTCEISGHEGDEKLGVLSVLLLWLGEDLGVENRNHFLKERELRHRVRNLASPQRRESFIEPIHA